MCSTLKRCFDTQTLMYRLDDDQIELNEAEITTIPLSYIVIGTASTQVFPC